MLLVCGVLSGCLLGLWRWIAEDGAIRRPELAPPFIQMEPINGDTQWILLAWLPLFFFNITGEELWWRGYVLLRQQQASERWAVLIHGLGLAAFHLPLGVDVTMVVLPFLFALPYVVKKSDNLWTSFILHGILNGGGFLAKAFGAI